MPKKTQPCLLQVNYYSHGFSVPSSRVRTSYLWGSEVISNALSIWRSCNVGNTFCVIYLEVTCREKLSCRVQLEGFSLPCLSPAGCFINAKCGAGLLPSLWWPHAQSYLDTTVIGVQGESWGLKGLSSAYCLHLDISITTKTLCCFQFSCLRVTEPDARCHPYCRLCIVCTL